MFYGQGFPGPAWREDCSLDFPYWLSSLLESVILLIASPHGSAGISMARQPLLRSFSPGSRRELQSELRLVPDGLAFEHSQS